MGNSINGAVGRRMLTHFAVSCLEVVTPLFRTFLFPRVLVACCVIGITHAQAASFDCTKAQAPMELTICHSAKLSDLDEKMAAAYKHARVILASQSQALQRLQAEQRAWLYSLRAASSDSSKPSCAQDENCLSEHYVSRIAALATYITPPASSAAKALAPVIAGKTGTAQNSQLAQQETMQQLQDQLQRLRALRAKARDAGVSKAPPARQAYCQRFWQALAAPEPLTLPPPVIFATNNEAEKKQMFDVLYGYAWKNYQRYLTQRGRVSPSEIMYEGKVEALDLEDEETIDLADLPAAFKDDWTPEEIGAERYYSVFYEGYFFDHIKERFLVYLRPTPQIGYVRPILFTVVPDGDKKAGLSLLATQIRFNGIPDVPPIIMLSKAAKMMVDRKVNQNFDLLEGTEEHTIGAVQLTGILAFEGNLIMWQLADQTSKLSAYHQDNKHYALTIMRTDSPSFAADHCILTFN